MRLWGEAVALCCGAVGWRCGVALWGESSKWLKPLRSRRTVPIRSRKRRACGQSLPCYIPPTCSVLAESHCTSSYEGHRSGSSRSVHAENPYPRATLALHEADHAGLEHSSSVAHRDSACSIRNAPGQIFWLRGSAAMRKEGRPPPGLARTHLTKSRYDRTRL